jgi:hypothetical protein
MGITDPLHRAVVKGKAFKQHLSVSKDEVKSQACWGSPVIPAPRRLRQEDVKFKTSLGYQ